MDSWIFILYFGLQTSTPFCCSVRSLGSSFSWFQCLFDPLLISSLCVCSEHSLTFCQCKMLQDHLLYFLPQSQSQLFLQGTLENGIRNQDIDVSCAHCYWDILASWPFQLTEQGDMYMCILNYVQYIHMLQSMGSQRVGHD